MCLFYIFHFGTGTSSETEGDCCLVSLAEKLAFLLVEVATGQDYVQCTDTIQYHIYENVTGTKPETLVPLYGTIPYC